MYDGRLGLIVKELEYGSSAVDGFNRFEEWASPDNEVVFELNDEKVVKLCEKHGLEKSAMEMLIFMDFKLKYVQKELESLIESVKYLKSRNSNRYELAD